ncbi:hypothetical protein N9344_00020 [bacterium]|nr:hypothetical protein [bacterium]
MPMLKILKISSWVLVIVVLVVVLGFVKKAHEEKGFSGVEVEIKQQDNNKFLKEHQLKKLLEGQSDTVVKKMSDFDVLELEKTLNELAYVKNAQVFKTIDGKIKAKLLERKPIARIFSGANSYYMDEDGSIMPPSSHYTSRVVVVSGAIVEPYAKRYMRNYRELKDSLRGETILDDIYKLTKYIDTQPFWRAQIEQVVVNKQLEFELIPKVGNHIIVLGDVDGYASKFNKLRMFYEKGLSKTGWNEYSRINLKYKNQVVCTKRY